MSNVICMYYTTISYAWGALICLSIFLHHRASIGECFLLIHMHIYIFDSRLHRKETRRKTNQFSGPTCDDILRQPRVYRRPDMWAHRAPHLILSEPGLEKGKPRNPTTRFNDATHFRGFRTRATATPLFSQTATKTKELKGRIASRGGAAGGQTKARQGHF